MEKVGIAFLCVSFIFASCASMQEDVYVDAVSSSAEISALEERFAVIDAQNYEGVEGAGAKEWQPPFPTLN